MTEKVTRKTHSLPDQWVGKRVVGWMNTLYGDKDWWICAIRDGKIDEVSNASPLIWAGLEQQIAFARAVCLHVNTMSAFGGAWLAGWIVPRGEGRERFYLLWKDPDGDIAAAVVNDLGWLQISAWDAIDFEGQCDAAIASWSERNKRLEIRPEDGAKLAQGDRIKNPVLQSAMADAFSSFGM